DGRIYHPYLNQWGRYWDVRYTGADKGTLLTRGSEIISSRLHRGFEGSVCQGTARHIEKSSTGCPGPTASSPGSTTAERISAISPTCGFSDTRGPGWRATTRTSKTRLRPWTELDRAKSRTSAPTSATTPKRSEAARLAGLGASSDKRSTTFTEPSCTTIWRS